MTSLDLTNLHYESVQHEPHMNDFHTICLFCDSVKYEFNENKLFLYMHKYHMLKLLVKLIIITPIYSANLKKEKN